MNLKMQNFRDLKQEFYTNRTAPKASRLLQKLKKSEISWLLRHHREGGITNEETWQRDYFDYLLAYYSILEIALLIGFVDKIPSSDRERALTELSHPALRKYYEENYPLVLPTGLRRRLAGREQSYVDDEHGKVTALFLEFTALTAYFETDSDLEVFLWFLEGGGRDGYWYKDLLRVLGSSERLMESMMRSPEEKTELDASVEGFEKFLTFSVQLNNILIASDVSKRFQSALFNYYAYWFQRLRKTVGSHMSTALNTYVEADLESDHDQMFFEHAKVAIDRLLSGVYA